MRQIREPANVRDSFPRKPGDVVLIYEDETADDRTKRKLSRVTLKGKQNCKTYLEYFL